MDKLIKPLFIFWLTVFIFALPNQLFGQVFTIDPADEQIDPNWNSVRPIIVDQYGYADSLGEAGLFGDIVSAWIVFNAADPTITYDPDKIYFRIDGYSIEDEVAVKFDCDGDSLFVSEVDRAITFGAIYDNSSSDSLGSIDGIVNYTPEYINANDDDPDLLSSETVEGEFVESFDDEADTEFIQIEAVYDLSGDKKLTGDLATCFGQDGPDKRDIAYQYSSEEDSTPIKSAVSTENSVPLLLIWLILGTMTFSLLILRRKFNQSAL